MKVLKHQSSIDLKGSPRSATLERQVIPLHRRLILMEEDRMVACPSRSQCAAIVKTPNSVTDLVIGHAPILVQLGTALHEEIESVAIAGLHRLGKDAAQRIVLLSLGSRKREQPRFDGTAKENLCDGTMPTGGGVAWVHKELISRHPHSGALIKQV